MEDKNKEKINVVELFGSNVFNDKIMQERLPKKVYKELHKTIDEGKELDPITAEVVAWGYERLGSGKRCNALHTLVPAAYWIHSRKT